MILSSKTKIIYFNLRTISHAFTFHKSECDKLDSIQCFNIYVVKNGKFLGFILDSHLNWKEHISHVKKKVYSGIRNLYLLKDLTVKS